MKLGKFIDGDFLFLRLRMDNLSRSTAIFIGFCLAVLLLVFLQVEDQTVNFIIKGIVIGGLAWIIYLYYQYLGEAGQNGSHSQQDDLENLTDLHSQYTIAQTHYASLQELIFSMVKAMNNEFEVGMYMMNPTSQNFDLQNGTVADFEKTVSFNNTIVKKCIDHKTAATCHQKDYLDAWQEIFGNQNWRGSECVVGQTLSFKDKPVGLILVKSDHFSDINPKDQVIIEYLGNMVSLSMEELDSLEKSVVGNNNKLRILDLINELNFKQDEPMILNKFRHLIRSFFNYDCLTISSLDETNLKASIKLLDGIQTDLPQENEFNIHGTLHGLPYSENKIINELNWAEKYSNLARFKAGDTHDPEFKSILGIPVFIDDEIWGCIMIERSQPIRFTKDDEKIITLVARILGAAILWLNEYQKIYQDAIRDGLTGLLNHKTFMERALEEIERARRFQHHLVFLMYDLDKFKRVNDTLGHPYGDYVIKTTAQIMKDNVRTIDVVARYGGEEFAIVLVNTTQEMALIVAQRIVDTIANHPFSMGGDDIKMTISSGLCEYPNDSDQLSNLIEFADQCLYETKKGGGNGVTVYGGGKKISDDKTT